MPADQAPTGVLDPTSMRPAGLSPFGLVLAAELELTLAGLAALRFPLVRLLVAWTSPPRALPPAPGLPVVSRACPTRDKSAHRQLIFRTTDASLSPRLAESEGEVKTKLVAPSSVDTGTCWSELAFELRYLSFSPWAGECS